MPKRKYTEFGLAEAVYRERNRVYQKEYLLNTENKKKHLARVSSTNRRMRESIRQLIAEFKVGGCELCGESEACCLSAHHIDPTKKLFNIGDAIRPMMTVETVLKEIDKCACLCHNCHAKIHAGVLSLATIRQ